MTRVHSVIGDQLRSQTRLVHAAVDRHELLRPLAAPDITRAEYALALRSLHALYAVLEPSLGETVAIGGTTYRFRHRRADLAADLAELGEAPLPDGGHFRQAVPNSPDEAVGVLYVLEGSRLGGAFIYGNLRKAVASAPLRFFADEGTDLDATWAAYHRMLMVEHHAIEPVSAGAAARRLFEALLQHLDACRAAALERAPESSLVD